MKATFFFLFFSFVIISSGLAQDSIPPFKSVDLNGKDVFMPGTAKGKYTILGFMASVKAQNDLITWYDPITDNFDWDTDVNIYFTVLLGGMSQNNSSSMRQKMKEVVLEEYYKNVLIFLGNAENLSKKLNMKDKDVPYFFVLDPEGKIVYQTSGAYTEDKLDEIIIAIDGEIMNK